MASKGSVSASNYLPARNQSTINVLRQRSRGFIAWPLALGIIWLALGGLYAIRQRVREGVVTKAEVTALSRLSAVVCIRKSASEVILPLFIFDRLDCFWLRGCFNGCNGIVHRSTRTQFTDNYNIVLLLQRKMECRNHFDPILPQALRIFLHHAVCFLDTLLESRFPLAPEHLSSKQIGFRRYDWSLFITSKVGVKFIRLYCIQSILFRNLGVRFLEFRDCFGRRTGWDLHQWSRRNRASESLKRYRCIPRTNVDVFCCGFSCIQKRDSNRCLWSPEVFGLSSQAELRCLFLFEDFQCFVVRLVGFLSTTSGGLSIRETGSGLSASSLRLLSHWFQGVFGNVFLTPHDHGLGGHNRGLCNLGSIDRVVNTASLNQNSEGGERSCQPKSCDDPLPTAILVVFGCVCFPVGFYFINKGAEMDGEWRPYFVAFGGYGFSLLLFVGLCFFWVVVVRHCPWFPPKHGLSQIRNQASLPALPALLWRDVPATSCQSCVSASIRSITRTRENVMSRPSRKTRFWLSAFGTLFVPVVLSVSGWTGFWPVLSVCFSGILWTVFWFRSELSRIRIIPDRGIAAHDSESAWSLLLPGLAVFLLAAFPFVQLYVTLQRQPIPLGFEDLLQTYMHDRSIYISDLARTEAVIHDKVFERVTFVGPAVVAFPLDDTVLDPEIETPNGDLNAVLLEVAPGQRSVGAIGFRNCVFKQCRFVRIQIAGPKALIDQIKAETTIVHSSSRFP